MKKIDGPTTQEVTLFGLSLRGSEPHHIPKQSLGDNHGIPTTACADHPCSQCHVTHRTSTVLSLEHKLVGMVLGLSRRSFP